MRVLRIAQRPPLCLTPPCPLLCVIFRAQGHLRPYNSGLTAAEALTSPFFGAERVQHAKLPVCTAAAFPSSVKPEHPDQEPHLLRDSP